MKKLLKCICLLLAMSIAFCVPAAAYDEAKILGKSGNTALLMSVEMIAREIETIKKEFPKAELSTSAAIKFANEMSQLSLRVL